MVLLYTFRLNRSNRKPDERLVPTLAGMISLGALRSSSEVSLGRYHLPAEQVDPGGRAKKASSLSTFLICAASRIHRWVLSVVFQDLVFLCLQTASGGAFARIL